MMDFKRKFLGATLATTIAVTFAVTPFNAALAQAKQMPCYGVNSCKGQSACKTAANACKGQNKCKGQGFLMKTPKECKSLGGKLMMEPGAKTGTQGY